MTPIHKLEPTMRGKTYQTNNIITQKCGGKWIHNRLHNRIGHSVRPYIISNIQFEKIIKKFDEKWWDAALEEVKQPHDRSCFKPIDVNNLTSW